MVRTNGTYKKMAIAKDLENVAIKEAKENSHTDKSGFETSKKTIADIESPDFTGGDGVSKESESRISDIMSKDKRFGGSLKSNNRRLIKDINSGKIANSTIIDVWEKRFKDLINDFRLMKTMPEIAKTIFKQWNTATPLINWKEIFKDYLNKALDDIRMVSHNRRAFASRGLNGKRRRMYGFRRDGKNMIDNVVVAIDTSGSISKDQVQIFINEVMGIPEIVKVNNMTIIYMSDAIDGVDTFSPHRGEHPNMTKYGSTGGNAGGFGPPFAYVKDVMRKDPSVFLYMTDGHAEYPNINQHDITQYIDRIIWFIVRNFNGSGIGPDGDPKTIDYDLVNDMPPFGNVMTYSVEQFMKMSNQ